MQSFKFSLLGLLLAARLLQGSGTVVRFEPGKPEIGPFPTDALTVADGAQKTGLRVNLPKPECQAEPSTCAEIGLINELDGFNLFPRVKVSFGGQINVDTLRLGIFFVWLEDLTNEEFGLQPLGHVTPINKVLYDPFTNTAYAKPDQILSQHRRYALVVTNAIRDVAGDPVVPSAEFQACIALQDGYCGRLGEVVKSVRSLFEPNQIVAASVFTTLSATAWLEKARDQLASTSPAFRPAGPKSFFKLSETASITYQQETRLTPAQFTASGLTLTYMQAARRVAFGSFRSPNFLNSQMVIPAITSGADVALPAELKEISFVAFLPDRPAPTGGYPVVIAGHGTDGHNMQIANVLADAMAAYGMATVAINAVGHGGGPASYVAVKDTTGNTVTVPHPGRAVDLDGDGTYDAGESTCTQRPAGARDCYRQTVIDLLQLVRTLKQGVDLDGDGTVDLDATRLYFSGLSMGAQFGTLFAAVSPDVPAVALAAGGGSFAELRMWGIANRPRAIAMLGSRNLPLLNLKNDFDPDSVLRYQPVHLITVPGALEIQEFFERIEWSSMPGDQMAYAPHLSWSTLPGVPIKRVLFQFGKGDRRAMNPTETALVLAAGMRETTSFYRHDLARAIWPDLNPDAHLYAFTLLPRAFPTNPFGQYLIASLALQQQAGFLASHGSAIPNVNVFTQLWFGKDLFETPPESLPEDLNFLP